VTAATATKPTRAMSDATRDAILSLGGTIAEAVERALSPGTPAQADGAAP
jgi:hypothetical protein